MHTTGFRRTVFTLVLATCVFAAAPVSAADATADATVNLYCTFKSGRKTITTTGSGVFVSSRGVILTNAHVGRYFLFPDMDDVPLKGSCTVRTGSPAKNAYTASVLYISPSWLEENAAQTSGTGEGDFALLYVTGASKGALPTTFPALPLDTSGTVTAEEQVTIAGYPTAKVSKNAVRRELVRITATAAMEDIRGFSRTNSADLITIASSAASSPGVSGGPVVNSAGNLIGLATAISAQKKDPALRAITTAHINRSVLAETGLPLAVLLWSDPALRAETTREAISADTLKTLRMSMFKSR